MMKKKHIVMIGILLLLTFLLGGCGNKAKSYYETALKHYNQGEYEASKENFAKAIELKSDNADYYIDYGYCLIQLGEYDLAEENFNKAILDKDNAIVNRNNKKAYRGLGIMYYKAGDYENALVNFNAALEIDSLNDYDMDIVSYEASTNMMLGNYEDAIAGFTKIIESKPKDIEALKSRGEVYYKVGDYDACVADYTAAKALDGTDYDVYIGLYKAYSAMGDNSLATAILEEATKLEIADDEDKINLAKIHYYQGNMEQALDGFQYAVELGYVENYIYMGDIYLQKNDFDSAIYYYESYFNGGGKIDANLCLKLGTCYINVGRYEDARKITEEGLKLAGANEKQDLLRNEIIAYEYLGDFVSAYTKMESYLVAYPEDSEAQRDLEFLKTRQGNTNASDDSLTTSDDIIKP